MADAGYLELEEGSEPATPAANLHKVYVDTVDDKVKHKRPDGVVVDLENAGGTVTSVNVSVPAAEFTSTGGPITTSGIIAINKVNQNSNTVWAGPTTGSPNPPTFRSLVSDDIPNLDFSKITTGSVPIARGGTNSTTALNNNRIMQSFAGAIVEANAITAARALISDANGIPTHSVTTAAELAFVNGVTSAIQTQINTKAPSASPTFTGTVTVPLTASRAVVTGAASELAASATTAAEIAFVSGVTSSIQTQLNSKIGQLQSNGTPLAFEPILNFTSIYDTLTDDPGSTRTNKTFNINNATQQAGINTDHVGDFLPIYDTSAVVHNKITPRSLNLITVPSLNWVVYEDFNNVVASYDGGLVDVNTGAGSGAAAVASQDATHMGLLNIHTGTTATGKGSVWNSGSSIVFGNGLAIWESVFQINQLSSGTQTYTLRNGFGDSITAESTDGVFFRYTDAVNSGQWQCVTRNNNVETVVNTTTAATAGGFHRFRIDINATATSAVFQIDGTTVGTITTNIPQTTARETGMIHYIQKSVGTTDASTYLDYIMAYKQINTQR